MMKKISSDWINNQPDAEGKKHERRIQEGRLAAVKYLGLSRKPSGRVALKLREQGYAEEEIREILSSLQDEGRIDDRRLARNIISRRRGRSAESRRALSHRLSRSGIDPEIIEEVLPDSSQDYDTACELLHSRFEQSDIAAENEKRKVWLKLARFLAARGFDRSTIIRALADYLPDIDTMGEDQA